MILERKILKLQNCSRLYSWTSSKLVLNNIVSEKKILKSRFTLFHRIINKTQNLINIQVYVCFYICKYVHMYVNIGSHSFKYCIGKLHSKILSIKSRRLILYLIFTVCQLDRELDSMGAYSVSCSTIKHPEHSNLQSQFM